MSGEVVECHSSYSYAERPIAFHWNNRRHVISAIENEKRHPGEMHFVVHTEENASFELIYNESEHSWHISPH